VLSKLVLLIPGDRGHGKINKDRIVVGGGRKIKSDAEGAMYDSRSDRQMTHLDDDTRYLQNSTPNLPM